MGKIIYSLKYGDKRTKLFLWGIILCALGMLASAVLCIFVHPLIFGILAVLFAVGGALLFFKAGFSTVEAEDPVGQAENGDGSEHISTRRGQKSGLVDDPDYVQLKDRELQTMEEPDPDYVPLKDRLEQEEEKEPESDNTSKKMRKVHKEEADKESEEPEEETEEYKEDYLKTYTFSSIKKLFKAVKMKGTPTPVLIDSCPSQRIRQCPSFVWEDKKHVCFLLLENKPRTITYAKEEVMTVSNKTGVMAMPKSDYENLKFMDPDIRDDFDRLLPSVYSEGMYGRYVQKKNLYALGSDMTITAQSLKSLMKVFDFRFKLSDKTLSDKSFSNYFREAYEWKFLWNDGVLTVKDYQTRIGQILARMTLDRQINDYDFEMIISQMIHYRLITDDYADFYRTKRSENR